MSRQTPISRVVLAFFRVCGMDACPGVSDHNGNIPSEFCQSIYSCFLPVDYGDPYRYSPSARFRPTVLNSAGSRERIAVSCSIAGGESSVCADSMVPRYRAFQTHCRSSQPLVSRHYRSDRYCSVFVLLRLPPSSAPISRPFLRSFHIREVSTGCNATDQEVAATINPIFDVSRFGVHFVASPRYADALLVTGPVGRAMQEPLLRCFDAMAEPRIVIAVGTCAISGGLHRDGYAEANGVDDSFPIAAYIPGSPPHPWSIIHGILIAMGRE